MTNKRELLILFTLLVGSLAVLSQPRNVEQAHQLAKQFFSMEASARGTAPTAATLTLVPPTKIAQKIGHGVPATTTRGATPDIGFYVFNDEINRRFVIISADERQEEVLGYSEDEILTTDNIPCGMLCFLSQYAAEYQYIQENDYDVDEEAAEVRKAYSSTSPLIQTKWDQSPVYNDQCPTYSEERCVTGCVATAMAQVMNYWQYPRIGEGVLGPASVHDYYYSNLKLNLSNKAFDWTSLKNAVTVTNSSSSAAKDAVAYLMKACGYAVKMMYDLSDYGGSGAYPANISKALINNFGYKASASLVYKSVSSNTSWENAIQNELSLGRPILYGGRGPDGGHRFILDGYNASTGKYHFNWGWGGMYQNTYFSLSSLTPGSSSFTVEQNMVYRIEPNSSEPSTEKPVINIDTDNDLMTVTCATNDVDYYYSFTPQDNTSTASYQRYYTSQSIPITCNGMFRAYVEKKGEKVYADSKSISWFKVDRPEFYPDGNRITIKCPSATAIYYTKNGSTPTKSSPKYTGPFTVTDGTTIKAIGVKANYSDSYVATHEYKEEIQTVYNFTNTAGKIAEKINEKSKLKVISLTVSGTLNGTDFWFIRKMAKDGELSRLDMKNATIVSGGVYSSTETEDYVISNYLFGHGDFSKLTSIVLPSNTIEIGNGAFGGCTALTELQIPASCKKIGVCAFENAGIKSLVIPKSVESIDWGIVQGCKSLTSISVESGNKVYDSRDNCNAIIDKEKNILIAGCIRTVIPSSVKKIEMHAFCSSPTKTIIPGNVESISLGAFEDNETLEEVIVEESDYEWLSIASECFKNCKALRYVTLPSGTWFIFREAFADCTRLRQFTIDREEPLEIEESVFTGSNYKSATLYVPFGCKAKYQKAAVWKDFGNIAELDPVVNSLAELKAVEDYTNVTVNLTDAQIQFMSNHDEIDDYLYLRDNTGAYLVQGRDLATNLGVKTGDYITGRFSTRKYNYIGAVVNTSKLDAKKVSVSKHGTPSPKAVGMDDLGRSCHFDLLTFSKAVLNGSLGGESNLITFKVGEKTVIVSIEGGLSGEDYMAVVNTLNGDLTGRAFNLTGIYTQYDDDDTYGFLALTQPAVEDFSGISNELLTEQPYFIDGELNLTSLPPFSDVKVYSISGTVVATYRADANGALHVSLKNLPTGCYIIAAKNNKYKVVRK